MIPAKANGKAKRSLASHRLITLPLFPAMTDADQDDVLCALDKVFAHYGR